MRPVASLLVLAAMIAAAAVAQPAQGPPRWVNPGWGRMPTLAEQAAATAGSKLTSHTNVHLGCHFDAAGLLRDCLPVMYKVTPEEQALALKLVPYYRLHPDYVRNPDGDVVFVRIYLGPNPDPRYQPPAPPIIASPGPPGPPRNSVITHPDWVRKPSGDAVERVYPKAARAARQGGRAVISCRVKADGTLGACMVISENPADMGFGEAAKSLAPQFRMREKTADGVPVAGATVQIPVSFVSPES